MDWNAAKRKRSDSYLKPSKYSDKLKFDSQSDEFLSSHSDSPSHRSEESVHSTDNYHYVKKIIKYSANSNHFGMNSKKPKKNLKNSKAAKNTQSSKISSLKFAAVNKKPLKKKKKEKVVTDPEKDEVIAKILQRWWYALEDWPPATFDYSAALKKQKLCLIPNEQAFAAHKKKEQVKNFPGYLGVYFSPKGIYDMRPQESCPSYNNLNMKPLKELREILVKALKNQISQIRALKNVDNDLIIDLQTELNSIKTNS